MTKRSESVSGDHGNRTHSVFTTNVAKYLRIKVSTRLSRPHLAIKGKYTFIQTNLNLNTTIFILIK